MKKGFKKIFRYPQLCRDAFGLYREWKVRASQLSPHMAAVHHFQSSHALLKVEDSRCQILTAAVQGKIILRSSLALETKFHSIYGLSSNKLSRQGISL